MLTPWPAAILYRSSDKNGVNTFSFGELNLFGLS